MSRYRLEALPVTLLREYAWCPRAAFFKIHGLWEPTTWSMAGGRYDAALLEELLRRHGVEGRLLLEYPLESPSLGLRGRADAVLVAEDWAAPVEAKRRTGKRRRRYRHHLLQAAAYCIAAEETLHRRCTRAFIVDAERREVKTLRVTPGLRRLVRESAEQLWSLARSEALPEATPRRRRCSSCFYRGICPASRTRM